MKKTDRIKKLVIRNTNEAWLNSGDIRLIGRRLEQDHLGRVNFTVDKKIYPGDLLLVLQFRCHDLLKHLKNQRP